MVPEAIACDAATRAEEFQLLEVGELFLRLRLAFLWCFVARLLTAQTITTPIPHGHFLQLCDRSRF